MIELHDAPLSSRLVHNSPLHGSILRRLTSMIQAGEQHLAQRHSTWQDVDNMLRLHVDLTRTARDASGATIDDKAEQPFRRSFMIPVTYANVMTRMAAFYGELKARDPVFHLEGVDTDDLEGARLHEAVLRSDFDYSRGPLVLWQLPFDLERYGMCILYDTWEEEFGQVYDDPILAPELAEALPPEFRPLATPSAHFDLIRQYNRWVPVDPYQFVFDGDHAAWDPQRGQFIGHKVRENWLHLYERRMRPDGSGGVYFNVEAVRRHAGTSAEDYSGRTVDGSWSADVADESHYPTVKLAHLQVRIIPSEWKLGAKTEPEVWWFTVADDTIIVRAHPSVYRHGEFTYSVAVSDLDMHAPFTAGTAEQLEGIQRLVDYLVFSHVENIRKMLNDAMVYDPALLNERDLLQPGPGRYVRLTKRGQQLLQRGLLPIPQMFSQIGVTDITGTNLATAQLFMEQAQALSGATATAQGRLFDSKRTLGEVERAAAGGAQRVGATLQLFDEQCLKPTVYRAIDNLQQFSSIDKYVKVSQDLAERYGMQRLAVRPGDLRGRYNYLARTPTMASDPARQQATWGALLQVLAGAPQLMAPINGKQLNPHAVFEEFAESAGVNYIDKFFIPAPAMPPMAPGAARVVPDEVAARAVERGNAVPMPQRRLA